MPQMDTATAPAATAGPTAAHSLLDARLSKIEDVARDTKLYTFERIDGGSCPVTSPAPISTCICQTGSCANSR